MDQSDYLERTRTLMTQTGLVEGFGLGRTWAIVQSCADWMAETPRQRYLETRDALRGRWPEEVHEIQVPKPPPRFLWHCMFTPSTRGVDFTAAHGLAVV